MKTRMILWGALALITLFGIHCLIIKLISRPRESGQIVQWQIAAPSPPLPPEPPRHFTISCINSPRKELKEHGYGAAITCTPEGDFLLSAVATGDELSRPLRELEVSFWITEDGHAVDAQIIRSSGSKDLDLRVLGQVPSLKFNTSRCKCRIEQTVPVELK